MQKKDNSWRKKRRLSRKLREAELRVNKRILKRIKELTQDKKLIIQIDKEIENSSSTDEYIKSLSSQLKMQIQAKTG
jgi:hypothetical protein